VYHCGPAFRDAVMSGRSVMPDTELLQVACFCAAH
jgi:hypothetical protein